MAFNDSSMSRLTLELYFEDFEGDLQFELKAELRSVLKKTVNVICCLYPLAQLRPVSAFGDVFLRSLGVVFIYYVFDVKYYILYKYYNILGARFSYAFLYRMNDILI